MANLAKCAEGLKKIGTTIATALGKVAWAVLKALACVAVFALVVEIVQVGPTRLYYAMENGVDPDRVTTIPKPHDCDFSKAPIGDKECHYEVVVTKSQDKQGDYVIVDWRRVNE
jgi:hypothetical protein